MAGSSLKQCAQDALSLHSVEYFLLLHSSCLQFVRVAGPNRADLLESRLGDSSDSEEIKNFLSTIKRQGYYYGQPVTVLLGNSKQFSYFKSVEATNLAGEFAKLKHLSHESVKLTHHVHASNDKKFIIAQGIDEDFLSSLHDAFNSCQFQVDQIATLSLFLFTRIDSSIWSDSKRLMIDFGTNTNYSLSQDSSGAICWTELSAQPERALHEETDLTFALTANKSKSSNRPASVARLLASKLKSGRLPVKLSCQPFTNGNQARMTQTLFNSTRMLASFGLIVLFVSLAATILFGLATGGDQKELVKYQTVYSERMEVQTTFDSLTTFLTNNRDRSQSSVSRAAIVSLLCQTRQPRMFLQLASVTQTDSDATRIDLQGYAKRQATVFKYQEDLNHIFAPSQFTVTSVRPEEIMNGSQLDTLFAFKFSLEAKR